MKDTFEKCLALSGTEKEKAFFANTELMGFLDPDDIAYKRLKVIHRAHNTDENGVVLKADFFNKNRKYAPWFVVEASKEKPSGFGFSVTCCGDTYAITCVGSRLSNYVSAEKAMEIGKTFEKEYIAFLLEE